jgi:hypothetical protein
MDQHRGNQHGAPALERGVAVGTYVLVRCERPGEDEQVWLARTATLPPSPITARLRPRPPTGGTSPFGQALQLGRWLQHPNLEAVSEELELGPWVAAISPGAPGVALPDLLGAIAALRARSEPQWIAAVTHLVASLLTGLDAAHRAVGAPGHPKGIVHGSVNPAALTVGVDGSVRLGGFGAMRDDDPSRVAERSMDALAYAAPEQFGTRGRVTTMDLWSAGAVLHELLDGMRFRGELTDVRALYRVALAGDVAATARPAPEGLERMRQWLLAKLPRDRPRSAADAVAAMGASNAGAAEVLAGMVRAHQSGGAPVEAEPLPAPAAAAPSFAQPAPSFAPPAMPMPQPAFASPFGGLPLPEDEGTVELDAAVLAAMRAGTHPPASSRPSAPQPSTAQQNASELQMPPPAARSSSRAAPSPSPQPVSPSRGMPFTPAPQPAMAPYPAQHAHAPAPPLARPVVAPRGASPMSRDPGPLELQPSYEPTTTTMLHARKSTRNFTILVVAAALVAITVGVGVGYLIVDDRAEPAAKPAKPDAPAKRG